MVKVIRHSIKSITGEDSEWTTNDEVVSDSDATVKCEVKTEQQQQLSPSSRQEPEEPPPSNDHHSTLRLNPNLATDPARWSLTDKPSPPQPPPLPPPPPPSATVTAAAAASSSESSSSSSSSSSLSSSAIGESNHNVVTITAPRAIQIFICNPCGIRFSSLSTLDAHQTYYCSRRHKKDSESDDVKLPMVVEPDEVTLGNDTDSRPSSVEPSAKSMRTGKQYKCPHCSYSADKKVSLNRHMRMHSISPVLVQSPPCPSDNADPSVVDRYCQNCDIRFSNLRTYQAHKTHYCNTRHVVKPTPSSSPMPNNPSPTGVVPTYLALPTNPVIVVPYTLVQNASVLSALSADIGPSPPTDTACIVLSDGTLQPIAQALVPTKFNMIANNDNIQRAHSQSPPEEFYSPPKKAESISPETKMRPAAQPSSPLDLRLKRAAKSSQDAAGCTDGEEEKENRRSDGNVTDAEDIVCAPSIPCMILSPSSSPTSGGGDGGGSKTPQHRLGVNHHHNQQLQQQQQQQQQQHHHLRNHNPLPLQPPTNGMVQHCGKSVPVTAVYDGTDRNGGKFSVSSLLHAPSGRMQDGVKQEPTNNGEPPHHAALHHMPAAHQRFSVMHKSILSSAVVAPMPPGVQSRGLGELLNPAPMLPYFTPDMTLRLTSNSTQDGGGMPPAHHQFYLKQGPSKCESCNIVFCKYENFLAHKKHYCASRPPPDGGDGDADKTSPEGSPGPKPLTVSSPQSSKDSASPTPVLKPPMIQFICSTCGVKFSSFDNLTTHQTFYCPNRTAVALQEPVENKAAPLALPLKCPKCKMNIDGTHHHQCQPANCWKCPVCGAVCSSASAAQKHLDNHNGIRAFVCTICQYKGNTLRGLRTHIRMHFNKRMIPDLMEEDYVTCLIDENSASSMVDGRAKTPTTSDSTDKPSAPSTVLVKTATAAAAATASLSSSSPSPSSSLSSTAAAAIVVVDDEPKELVTIKQEPVNGMAAPSADESTTGGYRPQSEQPAAASDDLLQQQLPPPQLQLQTAVGNKRAGITAKYCKACDISFNYLSTFIAHKKYYCRNSAEYKCNTENAKTATVT
ncbi:zinc finger protein ush-like isoform X2 [Melanaphis sacchari]|uniref:zinc finger protein ush-like isoform X2 n=1 Tax=Melanaphis sacchari TaxID=742174 RepID=UPI000DC139D1|nr:zinc finger protein ush-like isoform X2 [Melanaphis sacchari]